MPHIIVQHTPDVAQMQNGLMLGSLRGKLRSIAADQLSVPHRELAVGDFTIMFHEAGPWDVLMQDIQVIIFAHADQEQVDRADDLAESIAAACEDAVHWAIPNEQEEARRPVTFSLTLVLGQIGFYRSSEVLGDVWRPALGELKREP